MELWQTYIIAIGLTLDVFAYCLYKGAMVSEIRKKDFARMILLFTVFQAGMLALGCLLTRIPVLSGGHASAGRIWTILASFVFFVLGAVMIIKSLYSRNRRIVEQKEDSYNYRVIVFWAFLTSVDAFIAGIGFGFLGQQLLGAALVVAAITAAGAVAGFFMGYRLGCGPMNRCVTVGGCLVIAGSADLLIDYLLKLF